MVARKVTVNSAGRLTVTIDVADRVELDRLAKATDRSLAHVVREAVSDYIAKMRRELPNGGA